MKARFEHSKQEAESKLSRPTTQESLIKIRRNLHPPFLGEALEYMREFHKKHSTNDLYGLKARFRHIREARILGFEIDPYTDIDATDLPFSMEDLQYLRYHFEVFSAVSLFGLTADEISRVARLDAYLDTRDARIMYQEQAHVAVSDQEREEAEEDDGNPMGPSSITSQPNFLDGDVIAEETDHIDFVTVANDDLTTKDDNLKASLAELFPRSSSAKLHHLKPLYVTAHIEGYPVSKVFVNCEATVNIMPVNIMKVLRCSNDELIPSGIIISSFIGDKS
ncbi:hypothetical protein ACFX2J_003375 [Malus domestica]